MLIDINPEVAPDKALRFVLAPGPTPASAAYTSLLPPQATHDGKSYAEWCEICPEGLVLAKKIASRVMEDGGAALIADYGEEKITKNTLRVSSSHLDFLFVPFCTLVYFLSVHVHRKCATAFL